MTRYIFLVLFIWSHALSAGALRLVEVGTADLGVASAGSAAVARDAGTAFFNPAGMTYLQRSEFVIGAQALGVSARFKPLIATCRENWIHTGEQIRDERRIQPQRGLDEERSEVDAPCMKIKFHDRSQSGVTGSDASLFVGGNGGQAGVLFPTVNLYGVRAVDCSTFRIGLSVNSSYGGGYNFGRKWQGRYLIQRILVPTLQFKPCLLPIGKNGFLQGSRFEMNDESNPKRGWRGEKRRRCPM